VEGAEDKPRSVDQIQMTDRLNGITQCP
jgi:hypothetical protein